MTTGEFILKFAAQSPFTFFIVICAIYYAWKTPFMVIKRMIRSRDIQKNGWPTTPNMDADGDIIVKEDVK